MAKRRKTRTRRIYVKAKRSFKRNVGMSQAKLIQPDAMAYGAVRAPVSDMLKSVTSGIPVLNTMGSIGDEVAMGLLCWFTAKKTSGMLKKIAIKGLIVENAMLGAEIARGGINLFGSGTVQNSGSKLF